MNGYRNKASGVMIGVDNMPNRKKPCLFIVKGNVATKLATFSNNGLAEMFLNEMGDFLDCQKTDLDWSDEK